MNSKPEEEKTDYLYINKNLSLHINRRITHSFDFSSITRIFRVGIPFRLADNLFFPGRLIVLTLDATLGTPSIAANSIALILAFFSVLPGMALNTGMTPVPSQCIGAGDFEQVRFFGFGLFGTYLAMFIDWIVKAFIFTVLCISGRWMRFNLI